MSNSSVSNVAWERSFKNRTTFSAWNCPAHVANFCNLKDKTKRTFRIDFTAFPDQWVTETLSISSGREVLFKKDLQEFVQELATLSPDSSMVLTVLDVDPQDGQPRAPDTSYVTSIRARKGQARFRADLDREWDNSCAISGIQIRKMLRASHIVPWREASDHERLDPFNGILLSVHYDALFDAGLISFDDEGRILISDEITPHQNKLGLNATLRLEKTHPKRAAYLVRHRAAHGFTQK